VSACISSEGEYSDHTLDDAYMCTRCFALDEDSMTRDLLDLRAKLARVASLVRPLGILYAALPEGLFARRCKIILDDLRAALEPTP